VENIVSLSGKGSAVSKGLVYQIVVLPTMSAAL